MDERTRVLNRLRELRAQHEASTRAGAEESYMESEALARESYHHVASEAVRAGIFSEAELAAEGMPVLLDD